MAKKIQEPDFNLGAFLPEGVVNDFDIFYKPQAEPTNPAVKDLVVSLSNIVPSLTNYTVGQELKAKQKTEAQAVEDFNTNKVAFADLVKNKEIPAGANPHYFNKMMELDLNAKARAFQNKFDEYYANNQIKERLSPDAFKEAYKTQLETFYKENNLDKYDPLALNKAFFSNTSKFRDETEKKHNAYRIAQIEETTKDLAVKNYAGGLIDLQMKNGSIEDVHKFFKQETDDYISVTKNPRMANELMLSGIQNYVSAVNTVEGFEYAKKIVDSLSTLNLSGGDFAGSKRAGFIQKKMQNELLAKEIQFYDKQTNYNKVKQDLEAQNLQTDYFTYKSNNRDFSIYDVINDRKDDGSNKYSTRQQDYIIKFHNANQTALKLTTSNPDAILELAELQKTNPYLIKDRGIQLMTEGKLTVTDYQSFENSAGKYDELENNVYFKNSRPFKNLYKLFSDTSLTQIPSLKTELPLLRNDFEEKVLQYWNTIKDQNISPYEKQKKLDGEIKLILGEALQNSTIFSSSPSTLEKITSRYGIPLKSNQGAGN